MTSAAAPSPLERYYRWHSRIYDATRWAFLFGRADFSRIPGAPGRILEIGCGTGANLAALARQFPEANIVGIDLSADMLAVARRKVVAYGSRVSLVHGAYSQPLGGGAGFDLIVLSYCLSMVNPGYDRLLEICARDLASSGRVLAVDFHDSRAAWFRRWMRANHVRMDGHLLPAMEAAGLPLEHSELRDAYGGLWRWFTAVGVPPGV